MIKLNDPVGIGVGSDTPYIGIEITKAEAELIKNKKIKLYNIEGQSVFELRTDGSKLDDKYMIYVLFVDNENE